MLKKLLILFIVLAPLAVQAQDVKLAYINVQEIYTTMPEISGIEKQLADKQEEVTKNLKLLEDEYIKRAEEFEKSPATSDAIKQDQQKQLIQLQDRHQTLMQSGQLELQQLQQKLIEPVQKRIADAIKMVGDENKYTFVFDMSAMHYINPTATNITQQVKTKLGI